METKYRGQEARSQWRPKQYVLVGMGAILAISIMTVVASIILQPTDIRFSVSGFLSSSTTTTEGHPYDLNRLYPVGNDGVVLAFNLTACNPSHRAGVVYRYVLVSMQLQNNGRPSVRKTSVPAHVTRVGEDEVVVEEEEQEDHLKFRQKRNSNLTIGLQAILDNEFYSFYNTNASATIMVLTQARFKVGLASSRVYNIRVRCDRIYLASHSSEHNCSAVN